MNKSPKAKRGRKIEFDPQLVVDHAMEVFWVKGYEKTSYDDLVKTTGVNRYGLYNVLGDKESAFIKSLDNYVQTVIYKFTEKMRQPDSSINEICSYFENLKTLNKKDPIGCLVCNTITTNQNNLPSVQDLTEDALSTVRNSLKHSLINAEKMGELKKYAQVEKIADMLLGVVVGSCVLFRSSLDLSVPISFIDESLKILRTFTNEGD